MDTQRQGATAPDHTIGGYCAWRTAAAAQAFDLLWISRAGAPPLAHRVLPTGEPSLAVRRRRDKRGVVEEAEIVVCAVYDAPFWYRPPPGEELIALRLKPELSAGLFDIDVRDYRNVGPVKAPQAIRDRLSRTRRLAETGDIIEIGRALMSESSAFSEKPASASLLVGRVAETIRRRRGRVTLRALAQDFAVSERHLRRTFRNALAYSPKTYARRARLTAAAIAADASAEPDWAQIALETGFYDQAHLIAEYRALIGQTPAQNHRERRFGSAFSNTPAPS